MLRSSHNKKILMVICLTVLIFIGYANTNKLIAGSDVVQKAFELRINGNVDEARDMLVEYLEDKPDDAEAHYELARIYCYMVTGDLKNMVSHLDNADTNIKKALQLDPDNIIYKSFDANIEFLKSYMAMQQGTGEPKQLVVNLCGTYESVLSLKPDYIPILLDLVEIYSGLPAEMGGDKEKGELYCKKLEGLDEIIGAKARAMTMPEDTGLYAFWQDYEKKFPGDASVLEEIGKTYLRNGETEKGLDYLNRAIAADQGRNLLYLDMARYCALNLMMGKGEKEELIKIAEENLNKYLETEPIAPMKAYTLGLMAKLKFADNKKDEGNEIIKQAEAIDPYFSRASAIPGQNLFSPPDELSNYHSYQFMPL